MGLKEKVVKVVCGGMWASKKKREKVDLAVSRVRRRMNKGGEKIEEWVAFITIARCWRISSST